LKNSRAITFDSPGSMRSIERLQSNIISTKTLIDVHNLDIITYLVEPNFVNTADKHIGKVYSLIDTSKQSNNQASKKSSTKVEKILSIFTTESFKDTAMSTLNNHGLQNILKTMESDFNSDSIEPKSEELKYKPSKYSLMSNWPLIEKKPSTSTENSYTVTSIIGSMFKYGMNQINTNQPRAYYANKDDEFYSSYVINNNDLTKNEELNLNNNNLNVDYFLNKLKDINLDNLDDQLIKLQLKELKSSFRKEINLNDKIKIVSDKLNILKIKEIMIRLLDVSNKTTKEYLQSDQNLNIRLLENKSSNIKITNILSDFPKIFTGRSEELEKIKESLDNCQFVYIYGRSGTGKTTLASKYTYLLKNEKPDYIIRWIDANNLKQCFMNLAEELNIDNKLESEELFGIIKVTLNKMNRNILFVIDNLIYDLNKNIKNDFDYLLTNFDWNVKFLITTKNQLISKELSHEKYAQIELKDFDQDVCIKFIDQKLNIVLKNKLQKEEWIKLLQDYIYLRLPIYLNKLISRVNKNLIDSFENIRIYLQDEEKKKFSTLEKENPNAYEILKYFSFLNRNTISYDFICYLLIKKESNNEEKKIEKDSVNKGLEYLIENSEISINDVGPFYEIHETTQNDTMSTMSEEIQKEYLDKIISALNELISDDLLEKNKIRIDKELNEYKEHSENCLTFHLIKIENINEGKIELLEKCAYIYKSVLVDYEKALDYYYKSLEIRKETLPSNHPFIATSYNNIGVIYKNKGDNDKALEYYYKSLEIYKETLPPNHPDMATSFNNIGVIYKNKGDNDKALEYYYKSLEIRKETLPQNHPDIARSYNNIGLIYDNKDDNDKALEYYYKSLEIRKETLPPNHPDIARSYNNIGSIYNNKGDNDKALEYLSKSLEIRKETLPPNHLEIAITLYNIGFVYYKKKQFNFALEKYNLSLSIFRKNFVKDENFSIAIIFHNIGFLHYKECKYDLSLNNLYESLRIKKALFGSNENNSIAITHFCMAQVFESLGKLDLAQHNYSESIRIKKCSDPLHKGDDNISVPSDRFKNIAAEGYFRFEVFNFLK
jgi:Tfp pilus assembly protein PilF/energy-coupling factor transporter ATP-binding protein EcfA2